MISKNFKERLFTSILLFFLIFLIFNFQTILAFSLIILGIFSLLEFLNMIKKIFKKNIYRYLINSIFIIYISLFCVLFFILNNFFHLKIILFTILLGCAASDIGGFLIGKTFKGPKLTKISPNKTISGSLGSLLVTYLFIALIFFYFTNNYNKNILYISILTSVGCQIGDLFFSFLKRKAKIKDTGNFFPGHGGVLDRVDGIFLGLPIGYVSTLIFY